MLPARRVNADTSFSAAPFSVPRPRSACAISRVGFTAYGRRYGPARLRPSLPFARRPATRRTADRTRTADRSHAMHTVVFALTLDLALFSESRKTKAWGMSGPVRIQEQNRNRTATRNATEQARTAGDGTLSLNERSAVLATPLCIRLDIGGAPARAERPGDDNRDRIMPRIQRNKKKRRDLHTKPLAAAHSPSPSLSVLCLSRHLRFTVQSTRSRSQMVAGTLRLLAPALPPLLRLCSHRPLPRRSLRIDRRRHRDVRPELA